MRIIGITGGVGSGKTELLHYIGQHYNCRIILADEASHAVMAPGGRVYQPLVALLEQQRKLDQSSDAPEGVSKEEIPMGAEEEDLRTAGQKNRPPVLNEDGTINHNVMAGLIFSHKALLEKVNALIHPAVRAYIMAAIAEERAGGKHDYLFIEAALLIEEGYKAVVDELWYVYCRPEVRRQRLAAARGYSDEKTSRIMQAQLSDEEFLQNADVVIDNSGSLEHACAQVDEKLEQRRSDVGHIHYAQKHE